MYGRLLAALTLAVVALARGGVRERRGGPDAHRDLRLPSWWRWSRRRLPLCRAAAGRDTLAYPDRHPNGRADPVTPTPAPTRTPTPSPNSHPDGHTDRLTHTEADA